jgi:hypothetical protein
MKTQEEIETMANDFVSLAFSRQDLYDGFINGYFQCQQDMAEKKYTEEDIREAIDMARMLSHVSCLEDGEHRLKYSNTEEDIINSLIKQD